jgi:hypothetical protein
MASDLALHRADVLRMVEIEVPEERSIVDLAVGLYRDLGIDVEIADRSIRIAVGPVLARPVQAILERYTGIPAHNAWDDRAA